MKIVRFLMVLAIIALMIAFVFSKNNWDAKIEQHSQQSMENVAQMKSTEAVVEKEEETETIDETSEGNSEDKSEKKTEKKSEESAEGDKSEFYNLLLNQEIASIKLLGDGITAGYGHSAYSAPDGGRIIFSGNGETFREAGTEFGSWANELRDYVNKPEFGNVDVINAGIRDKTADWAFRNLGGLLKKKEDAVVVMIGTDDRIFSTLEAYEATMRSLLAEADKRSEYLIVMSPPPSKENLQPYAFTMEEIDGVLKKISEEKGYLFISQFNAFREQLANGNDYGSLMQTASANPKDSGYTLIWKTVQEELGLE